MSEQGSLQGEGTHRGNLFIHTAEQYLPSQKGRARLGEISSPIILNKMCQPVFVDNFACGGHA